MPYNTDLDSIRPLAQALAKLRDPRAPTPPAAAVMTPDLDKLPYDSRAWTVLLDTFPSAQIAALDTNPILAPLCQVLTTALGNAFSHNVFTPLTDYLYSTGDTSTATAFPGTTFQSLEELRNSCVLKADISMTVGLLANSSFGFAKYLLANTPLASSRSHVSRIIASFYNLHRPEGNLILASHLLVNPYMAPSSHAPLQDYLYSWITHDDDEHTLITAMAMLAQSTAIAPAHHLKQRLLHDDHDDWSPPPELHAEFQLALALGLADDPDLHTAWLDRAEAQSKVPSHPHGLEPWSILAEFSPHLSSPNWQKFISLLLNNKRRISTTMLAKALERRTQHDIAKALPDLLPGLTSQTMPVLGPHITVHTWPIVLDYYTALPVTEATAQSFAAIVAAMQPDHRSAILPMIPRLFLVQLLKYAPTLGQQLLPMVAAARPGQSTSPSTPATRTP